MKQFFYAIDIPIAHRLSRVKSQGAYSRRCRNLKLRTHQGKFLCHIRRRGSQDSQFSSKVARADGLILVVPEYNHSFPGLLKHVLDTNLKEYVHKAVGVCGVSAGPFGGARMIQSLLPVLRELGLVMIFSDVYFGTAGKLFDPATGKITDLAYSRRVEKFLNELVWMARALRHARENLPA